jgi:hypothetical protein
MAEWIIPLVGFALPLLFLRPVHRARPGKRTPRKLLKEASRGWFDK